MSFMLGQLHVEVLLSAIREARSTRDRKSFSGSVLKLVRCPHSLAPTLVALPSMSRVPTRSIHQNRVARQGRRNRVVSKHLTFTDSHHDGYGHLVPKGVFVRRVYGSVLYSRLHVWRFQLVRAR